ncbi:DUF4232 domain-containing protein [Streptomyces sp. NPDC048581]|uniref:DUF4232 domain-containing protein n=1 Tax=unclassified Streptomyces TaxID=2593676 RepID=UPI003714B73D
MRATSLTVTALAAALLLTACADGGDGKDADSGKDTKAAATCADQLAVRLGPANAAPAVGDTGNVTFTVTNRSGAECTLDGGPGFEFDAGSGVTGVALDPAVTSRKTTFPKEASSSFTVTYVRGEGGGTKSLAVKSAKIRLPGAAEAHSFKWSYGDVALKSDGKTADASVSGFQQTGD